MSARFYPIGEPGTPWGDSEKNQWRQAQKRQRSYADDVVGRVRALADRFSVVDYGVVADHPLLALRSKTFDAGRPTVIVTGGVHGYETSGVHGALAFAEAHADAYADRVNLVIVPCVSPWAYEHIQRWNAFAIDPNRSFRTDDLSKGPRAAESVALLRFIEDVVDTALLHIDLHETTDSDDTEFRPAVAARDGKTYTPGTIPDGFYLVDNSDNPQPAFQAAIIAAVQKVTHIAPADAKGELIGCPVKQPGVIEYPVKSLGLCAGMTNARFTTTTEVYPDSPTASADICNAAQVAAVCAAIDFALSARAG